MKNFKFLHTDFYQISMGFAYVVEGINTQVTGFEGFVRHVKPATNPDENFYIFDGEAQVIEYMETIREELKDPELLETFIELIEPKITAPNKDELIQKFRENWKTIDTNFEYTVVPNGTVVFPLVPVFQYRGDKFVGQIIETYITNIYNGRTGLATLKYLKENGSDSISDSDYNFLTGIMNGEPEEVAVYIDMLTEKAKEFRKSTDKILLEASFRRAPSFLTANIASLVAIKYGWNGTSNVSNLLSGDLCSSQVGGTTAHSWVMSFNKEEDAYRAWDKIFPGTTMLIDTYDVENAARMIKKMIEADEITPPNEVRIDSDPLDEYAKLVDNIFDSKMNIYVSGDMSVEKFNNFNNNSIPYSKAMVGTKYVYDDKIVAKLNCGFVYKIVEFERDGEIIRPEKKSTGKKNYPGLKAIIYDNENDILNVYTVTHKGFGFTNIKNITSTTKVVFR